MKTGIRHCLLVLFLTLPHTVISDNDKPWSKDRFAVKELRKTAKSLFGPLGQIKQGELPTYEELIDPARHAALVTFQWQVMTGLDQSFDGDIEEIGLKKIDGKYRWMWQDNPRALPVSTYLVYVPARIQHPWIARRLIERGLEQRELDSIVLALESIDPERMRRARGLEIIREMAPDIRANSENGVSNEKALLELSYRLFRDAADVDLEVAKRCLAGVSNDGKRILISFGAENFLQDGFVVLPGQMEKDLATLERLLLSGALERSYEQEES